jgi:hypothetical protein
MPRQSKNTSSVRRSLRQNNTDDSSVDEDTVLSQLNHTKKRHPGEPKQSNPPRTTTIPPHHNSNPNHHTNLTAESTNPSPPNLSSSHSASSNNSDTPDTTTTTKHRQINHRSTNRRQCKRASDDLSRSTPDQNNLSQRKHAHSTRLTFKMFCPPCEDVEAYILNAINEFVADLVKADPTAAVLPWKSIDRSKTPLTKKSDVPKSIKLIRPYLHKFYINRTPHKQFTTYPGIHIGHDKSISDIREDMDPWLHDGGHGLFYKMLQAEDCTEIGWFLYSTKEMDAGALVDEIADLVGVQIGLRWKVIDVGAKGKLPESQMIRALNVEVDSKYQWESQRKLINYFGKKN